MTDITNSTDVPLRDVLAKIAIREKDNQELRRSLKQLTDTMEIFETRLGSCPWPQLQICPGKPPDDVLIGSDSEKDDVAASDNSIDNVIARLAVLDKDHQELKSSVQKLGDIVNAFEGKLDKLPCEPIQICPAEPEDANADSKVDGISASTNVSIYDVVSRIVILEESNKGLKISVQELQDHVETFDLRLENMHGPPSPLEEATETKWCCCTKSS